MFGFYPMMGAPMMGAPTEGETGKGPGPGWRRLASQRVLSAIREADDEEALLLLLS